MAVKRRNLIKKEVAYVIVRRSVFILTLKLLIVESFFIILSLVVFTLINILSPSGSLISDTKFLFAVLYIMLSFFRFVLFIVIILNWSSQYYEIKSEGVIFISGVLGDRKRTYYYRNIESITLMKGIIGKIFNFGTIRMYNPSLNEYFYLKDISSPEKYIKIIKSNLFSGIFTIP